MVNVYLNSRIRKGFTPITYPSPVPIGMIRKDILMDIGFAEFASLFHIGKVYDEKHCLSDDFFSFVSKYPEKEVRITGGDTSTVNACQSCNRVLYFPLPLSEWHIEDLNRQCFLYPSVWTNSFFVDEEAKNTLKNKGYKKIGYIKNPIKD